MRAEGEGLRNAEFLPHPLRDYSWLKLPGRCGATDFDCVVERYGHFLLIEMKHRAAPIPRGQAITFYSLWKQDWTIWIVRTTDKDGVYGFAPWTDEGEGFPPTIVTSDDLSKMVVEWFEDASEVGRL